MAEATACGMLLCVLGILSPGTAPVAASAAESPLASLEARYVNAEGKPSYREFLRAHGLLSTEEHFSRAIVFKVVYLSKDLTVSRDGSGKVSSLEVRPGARAVYTDVEAVRMRASRARLVAEPIWDSRVYADGDQILVGGFTRDGEKPVGHVDHDGGFVVQTTVEPPHRPPFLSYPSDQLLLDPFHGKLLKVLDPGGGTTKQEEFYFLPFDIRGADRGQLLAPGYRISESEEAGARLLRLTIATGAQEVELASAPVTADRVLSAKPGYAPVLGSGCTQVAGGDATVLALRGDFGKTVAADERRLRLSVLGQAGTASQPRPDVVIDGRFDDWRSVPGVNDARGDKVHYLDYNPDTDILQFKVANDDKHLFLYSRVAGRHGANGPGGRYYWYAYIDADRNPNTGYPPTRDDNCYFGVDLGDDCEAQFEFVGGRFLKTFFGFTGVGAEKEVLTGRVRLGPSHYSRRDERGRLRDRYKVEYVRREGRLSITEDYTEGTSQDIVMALSSDGSEAEVAVELSGFLSDENGRPLLSLGQSIDLAVGAEASCELYGGDNWGADSSPVIYGYTLR